MQIIDNIPVWGAPVDEGALKQIKTCYYIFGQAAMMADHHKGYGVPIGGVIAHETWSAPRVSVTTSAAATKPCSPTPTRKTCARTSPGSWTMFGTISFWLGAQEPGGS